MKIISGKFRGRKIECLNSKDLRPTTGQIREAIFSILNSLDYLNNDKEVSVLDLFCGTGSLGLEALSRGLKHVTFVDINQQHLSLVEETAGRLGVRNQIILMRWNACDLPKARQQYNVVFMDPPYHDSNLLSQALSSLVKEGWLAEDSIIIAEFAKKNLPKLPEGIEIMDTRIYGKSKIFLMRAI
jgi:16S rRNA (guanine966-N2)-methyltransferase